MSASKRKPVKQHDLRGASLARLADDCEARAKDIPYDTKYATERILTLQDLADIFRAAAKRERKLR